MASEWARVVVDSRNADKDVFLPRPVAEKWYKQGLIAVDVTNSGSDEGTCYTPIPEKTPHIHPGVIECLSCRGWIALKYRESDVEARKRMKRYHLCSCTTPSKRYVIRRFEG